MYRNADEWIAQRINRRRLLLASSGETGPFAPAALGDDLFFQFEADDAEFAPTDAMPHWTDQSSHNVALTQVTGTAQPTLETIDGLPTVQFATGQYFNFGDILTGLSAGHIFAVVRSAPASQNGLWHMGVGYSFYPFSGGELYEDFGKTGTFNNTGIPAADLAAWHIYEVMSKAGQRYIKFDGALHVNEESNTVGWSTTPKFGANKDLNAFFGGPTTPSHARALIMASRELTAPEAAGMRSYLLKHIS